MMICYWRFVFALMTFIGLILVYMLRVNISVAIVSMVNSSEFISANYTPECSRLPINESLNSTIPTGEFNWSSDDQAKILSSFYWGYTIMQIPSGLLLIFFKPKWIYGLSTLLTSILTFLIPLAANHGVGAMVALRFLMGICEGPTFPAFYTLGGFWILPKENSIVSTFIISGSNIGTIVGQSLTGFLIDLYGWRVSFYIMSTFGCVWFLVFAVVVHNRPEVHPFISQSERELLIESRPTKALNRQTARVSIPWRKVMTSSPYFGLIVFAASFNFTVYTMINCLPLYIGKVLGFNIAQNGAISSLPFIALMTFSITGGLLQDYFKMKNILSKTKIRKLFGCVGMLSCSAIMFNIMFTGCNIPLSIGLVCFSIAMLGFSSSVNSVNVLDLSPQYAGPLMAIVNVFNSSSGIVSPYVKEFFTRTGETRNNWASVFITNSAVLLFGATVYLAFGSGTLQPWDFENNFTHLPSTSTISGDSTEIENSDNLVLRDSFHCN